MWPRSTIVLPWLRPLNGSSGEGVTRPGRTVLGGRQSQCRWRLRHQHVWRLDCKRTPRGRDGGCDAGFVFPATEREDAEGNPKERSQSGCDLQHRWRAVRFGVHRVAKSGMMEKADCRDAAGV